jgi:hypothetical protein
MNSWETCVLVRSLSSFGSFAQRVTRGAPWQAELHSRRGIPALERDAVARRVRVRQLAQATRPEPEFRGPHESAAGAGRGIQAPRAALLPGKPRKQKLAPVGPPGAKARRSRRHARTSRRKGTAWNVGSEFVRRRATHVQKRPVSSERRDTGTTRRTRASWSRVSRRGSRLALSRIEVRSICHRERSGLSLRRNGRLHRAPSTRPSRSIPGVPISVRQLLERRGWACSRTCTCLLLACCPPARRRNAIRCD